MLNKKCAHILCNQVKNNTFTEEAYRDILKENKLAITKPRLAILKTIMSQSLPLTVDELHRKLGKVTCDMATVYRVLGQFVDTRLVNILHLEKDLVHYEYNNPHHHHHHIICNQCKKIELIEECLLSELEQHLFKKGYKNIGHQLQFFGTCKSCAA